MPARVVSSDANSQVMQDEYGNVFVLPPGIAKVPEPAPTPAPAPQAAPEPVQAAPIEQPPVDPMAPHLGGPIGVTSSVSDLQANRVSPSDVARIQATPEPVQPAPVPKAGKQKPQQVQAQDPFVAAQQQGLQADQFALQAGANQQQVIAEEAKQAAAQEAQGQAVQEALAKQQQDYLNERNKVRAQKEDEANAFLQKASEYKIDENRKMNSLSDGKRVLFWVSAAMAGLGQAIDKQHGPNPVLQMMESAIDRDVKLQMDERDQLRQSAADKYHAIDRYNAFTTDRLSQYNLVAATELKRTESQLKQIAGKLADPRARANIEALAAATGQKAADRAQLAAQGAFDREMQARQMRNTERATAISGGHLALANKQFAFNSQLQTKQLELEAAKLAKEGNAKAAEQTRTLGIAGMPVLQKGKDGKPSGVTYDVLRNSDGSAALAATEKEGQEVRKQVGGAKTLVSLVDQIKAIRDKEGWQTDLSNSAEYQRIKSLFGQAIIAVKNDAELGVLAGPDMGLIEKMLGASDPGQYKDFQAALTSLRDGTISKLNDSIRARTNYDGKPIDFPPLKDAVADEGAKQAYGTAANWQTSAYTYGKDPAVAAMYAKAAGMPMADTASDVRGFTPTQQAMIDANIKLLTSSDPKVKAGAQAVLDGVKKYGVPGLKDYVDAKLKDIKPVDPVDHTGIKFY